MKDGGHNQFMGEDPNEHRNRVEIGTPDEQTRAFSLETVGKEPPERCEERSAIRDLPAGVLAWRMLRPLLILLISVSLVWFIGSFGYRYVEQNYIAPGRQRQNDGQDGGDQDGIVVVRHRVAAA